MQRYEILWPGGLVIRDIQAIGGPIAEPLKIGTFGEIRTPMATITRLDQLDPNKQYTYADYLTWQFSDRVELLWGYIRQMAAPNQRHQQLASDLHGNIWTYLRGRPCRVYLAPFDVRLPRKHKLTNEDIITVIQPDLCIICDLSKIDKAGCLGAPDWIIEILSKGNTKKEMKEKFDAYEESGVREYWIVQPAYSNILVYTLQNEKFQAAPTLFSTDQNATSHCFPDLTIDLNEVFAD